MLFFFVTEDILLVYLFFASYIMEEYQDCLKRARRLAVACEATLTGSDSAMSVVTMEDLLIYTRWLICMLHSVKAMHALIRVSIRQYCSLSLGGLAKLLLVYCGTAANNLVWSQNQPDFVFDKKQTYLSCW